MITPNALLMTLQILASNNQLGGFPTDHLPIADCPNCFWMGFPHDGGHCYMFRDAPENNRCAKMQRKDSKYPKE